MRPTQILKPLVIAALAAFAAGAYAQKTQLLVYTALRCV